MPQYEFTHASISIQIKMLTAQSNKQKPGTRIYTSNFSVDDLLGFLVQCLRCIIKVSLHEEVSCRSILGLFAAAAAERAHTCTEWGGWHAAVSVVTLTPTCCRHQNHINNKNCLFVIVLKSKHLQESHWIFNVCMMHISTSEMNVLVMQALE